MDVDNQRDDSGTLMETLHLGGFQEAASLLSVLSQHHYSRQAVHQLWKRRNTNSFPDRKQYLINGHVKLYFDMNDVRQWYEVMRTNTPRWEESLVSRSRTGRFISNPQQRKNPGGKEENG